MPLPFKLRRAVGIAVPLFTFFLLSGIFHGLFGVGIDDNIAQTGIKVGFIFAILNFWLWWLIFKHRIP